MQGRDGHKTLTVDNFSLENRLIIHRNTKVRQRLDEVKASCRLTQNQCAFRHTLGVILHLVHLQCIGFPDPARGEP